MGRLRIAELKTETGSSNQIGVGRRISPGAVRFLTHQSFLWECWKYMTERFFAGRLEVNISPSSHSHIVTHVRFAGSPTSIFFVWGMYDGLA
jgi:hypothetical protein